MPSRRLLLAFGLLAAAAAVSVLVPGLRLLVLAGDAALLIAGVLDAAAARRSEISARRIRPPLLVQDEPAPVRVELTAPGARRTIRVRLREGLSPAVAAVALRESVDVVPGRTTVWSYRLEPRRRGEHVLLPLTARVEGPWRLAWVQREVLPPEPVRI